MNFLTISLHIYTMFVTIMKIPKSKGKAFQDYKDIGRLIAINYILNEIEISKGKKSLMVTILFFKTGRYIRLT